MLPGVVPLLTVSGVVVIAPPPTRRLPSGQVAVVTIGGAAPIRLVSVAEVVACGALAPIRLAVFTTVCDGPPVAHMANADA